MASYKFYMNKEGSFAVDLDEIRSIRYYPQARDPYTILYKDGTKEQCGYDIAVPLLKYLRNRRG